MTVTSPSPEPSVGLRLAVEVADGRQAIDLKVLELEAVSDFTDHFLICSGSSSRQVQAIADAVERRLRDGGVRPLHIEGARQGRWVLMDYGEFIVHIFDPERRDYFRLEDIWSDAPDITDSLLENGSAAEL